MGSKSILPFPAKRYAANIKRNIVYNKKNRTFFQKLSLFLSKNKQKTKIKTIFSNIAVQ
jgi:hypothetical protein